MNVNDLLNAVEEKAALKNKNIEKKNDNRSDRDFGFSEEYKHQRTNKIVSVHCQRSATGKTLYWTFTSQNIKNQEEFEQLCNK